VIMVMRFLTMLIALFWAVTAAAQSGYQIQPGDTLSIEVLEDPALNRTVLILPDGSFSFPLVGRVSTRGRTAESVQSQLASTLAPNFASSPTVFVSVAGLNIGAIAPTTTGTLVDIFVMGEVNTPGRFQVEAGTTLLQFLAESGGFTRFAATNRVQLRRAVKGGGDRVYIFNYRAVEKGVAVPSRTTLVGGDVIVVPQRKLFE
jgi:polysaccharide export outer membrane protein